MVGKVIPVPIREQVAAYKARQIASGRVELKGYVPKELVAAIDKLKEEWGVSSRAPIIEEALRFYFEQKQGS